MVHSTLLFLLATSLPLALSQSTTFPAYFAPPRVAASVVTVGPSATTYALQCTSLCDDSIEKGAGTIVNGPATAGLTQIWAEAGAQKTLIYDCGVKDGSVGNCVVKAVKDGETGTGSFSKTTTFKQGDLVVTGGLEQLGIAIATTTMEVNTTVTAKKTTKAPIAKSTLSSSSTNTSSSTDSSSTDESSAATDSSSTSATTSLSRTATPEAASTSTSSAAAAATLKAERVGGAILGLAGLLLAAL